MRSFRPSAVGLVLVAFSFLAAPAFGQVLDQVPANALVVLKVKNLQELNQKVSQLAQKLGLDQQMPELKDPLNLLTTQYKMGKGLNKNGDLALAFVDPATVGGDPASALVMLIPTTDYKAFLGNFANTADVGNGVMEAQHPDGPESVFVANWGAYAAVSPAKESLAQKPTGLKLTGFASKESQEKDILLYTNIKVVSKMALPKLKDGKAQLMAEVERNLEESGASKFSPLVKAVVGQYMAVIEEFLTDAQSATISLNLTDAGIGTTIAADFEPTSYLGKLALQNKPASSPLLAGLPDRKYFAFGGGTSNPELTGKLMADLLDPIIAELKAVEETAKFVPALEAVKTSYGSLTGWTQGYVAPQGEPGKEALLQQVSVVRGDAKNMKAAQKEVINAMNTFMQQAKTDDAAGPQVSMQMTDGAKTVAGVKFDEFKTEFNMPQDDPQALAAQNQMKLVFGENGMSGVIGEVDPETLVVVQGGDETLIADTVGSAKANTDSLGARAGVRVSSAALPKNRTGEFYLDVGMLVTTSVRYAQEFGLETNVKLPEDLPPIGFSTGTDASAIRIDIIVPSKMMEGLMSAALQAQQEMMQQQQQPGGGV